MILPANIAQALDAYRDNIELDYGDRLITASRTTLVAREAVCADIAELAAQRDGLLVAAKAVQELLGDDLDAPRIVDFRQACVRDLWDAFVEAIARAQPEQPKPAGGAS